MKLSLYLPLIATLSAALLSGVRQRKLRPTVASWAFTAVTIGSALATVGGLVMILLSSLIGSPVIGARLAWCFHFHHEHRSLPWFVGIGVVTWLALAALRVVRCRRRYRELRDAGAGGTGVTVLTDEPPTAYSLPGRRGRIVVSDSMLATLSEDEQSVLFAHERSHLRHRHDRFIHVADLAAAVVPPLRLLARRVRFATERWADEDAAEEVGDRRLVARALSRAALAQAAGSRPALLSMAGFGVPARVEELLGQPTSPWVVRAGLGVSVASSLVVLTGSTAQLHHLGEAVGHLCRLS